MPLEVVYDCPGQGQIRMSVFEAARQQMMVVERERGRAWIREHNYLSDDALIDFISVHWAWLEVAGRRFSL